MSAMQKATLFKTFLSSERGNVAAMFAIALLTILSAIGAAFDYAQMSDAKKQLQNALDGGVLAAAAFQSDSISERETHGKAVALENLKKLSADGDIQITISIDENGVVTGSADMNYKPVLVHMFGFDELDLSAISQASSQGSMADAEIVMVLDYSSSMNGQYGAMRDAAINLITTLTENDRTNIEFGLVPFAEEVYLQMDGKYAVGGKMGVPWQGCTVSRKWPFVISDRTPTASDNSKWGEGGSDCDEYPSRNLVVHPLNANADSVINQLRAMRPHYGTNTSLGVELGYQLLSPNLPFAATDYAGGKKKFLVILSDGELTRGSYGPGNIYSRTQAHLNLQTICKAAALKGVTIVTVLYETTSSTARTAMRNCASSPDNFMEASAGTIASRFELIADLVKSDIRLNY